MGQSLDQHPDRPSGTPQPYQHGQPLGFLIAGARQGCRCNTEGCGEPGRAQMDIDLVGPDIFVHDCQVAVLI